MTPREWLTRLRHTFLGGRSDHDLAEELRHHLEFAAEAERRRGHSDREAARRARLQAGGAAQALDAERDQRALAWLLELGRDLRVATRTLRRAPTFTLAAVFTLALGIGANTAIFSVYDGVLLKPLGYGDEGRLVAVHELVPSSAQPTTRVPVNALHFQEWRRQIHAIDNIALIGGISLDLTGNGEPERLSAARVSPSLFPMLGARMQLGRAFREDEDQPGHDNVVILSPELWRRRFASDPGIVGRAISLGGRPYEVVGVLSEDFHFPELSQLYALDIAGDRPEVWKPFGVRPDELGLMGDFSYACIARLRPGVSIGAALDEWNAAQARIASRAAEKVSLIAALVPLKDQITGRSRLGLQLLMAAVAIVLLIGTANIANLLITRTTSRRREFAIRAAMGAGTRRLVRQLLAEALLLATLGGALGLLVGVAVLRVLVTRAPIDLARVDEVGMNLPVLLFTAAVSLAAGLVCGVIPALRASRAEPIDAMKSGARGSTESGGSGALRAALVAVEVGLCTLCLMAGGLLLRSFTQLMAADKGFDAQHVITVNLQLPDVRYPGDVDRTRFFRALLDAVRPLPGVVSAGVADMLPLSGEGGNNVVSLEGTSVPFTQRPLADIRGVNPDYFPTLGIPLRQGRIFDRTDGDHQVAVVSAQAADQLWPRQNPVGKRFKVGGTGGPYFEVVGVVADVHSGGLDRPPSSTVYLPYWQRRTWFGPSLAVRTTSDPAARDASIRAAIRGLDPDLPIPAFQTLDRVVDDSVAQRRFQKDVTLIFALTALVMASLGIYGVVSYSVASRTNEMGIRIALGAPPLDILRTVLGHGLAPVVVGLAAGLAASFAAGSLLSGLLYGVTAMDPITIGAVIGLLGGVALVATIIPARRAIRVDPLTVLHRG
jgi:putative ABC transport system permease protein